MHLVLALDQGFEALASVALTSFLLHHSFESVVVVAPEGHSMERLSAFTTAFHLSLRLHPSLSGQLCRASDEVGLFLLH